METRNILDWKWRKLFQVVQANLAGLQDYTLIVDFNNFANAQ